jgi:hypothetical protein
MRWTALLVAVAGVVAALVAADATAMSPQRTSLLRQAPRRLAGASWWGGTYALPDGEDVTVYLSKRYPEDDSVARRWAAFFGGLPHGQELSLVKVYVAPLDEVRVMCFDQEVIGCYGDQELVTVGETTGGMEPTSIAAHEYGHHIAANRNNAPWTAVNWGTKRWASAMGICPRAAAGTAFPGDEGLNYSLNPGEAFAESYRVLVQTGGAGGAYDWPIVDPSFRPSAEAIEAIRADVANPWTGPTTTTTHATFRGRKPWTTTIATPLDGDLSVRVRVPGGGADDVTLLSSDGKRVLARGYWNSVGGKEAHYRLCGTRSLVVRVSRGGSAARFTLRVAAP